ncbi:hypothetical protein LCGC14_0790690 [marine sediment metagenome]|uniref:dUTP diphosphatase n=1 Tax=marine sediment metagenome TaxID=412755 RepID=A0A0F9PSP6_9ZZZZ
MTIVSNYDTDIISIGSHKIFDIVCDYGVSDKCRGQFKKEFRTIVRDRKMNNGKDICLYCSRSLKFNGRNNPNMRYNLDDNYFSVIDDEIKSYILGLIASDGSITSSTITIALHYKDVSILYRIRDILCTELKVGHKHCGLRFISLCSSKMVVDVCKHLNIHQGKKSYTVDMPSFSSDSLAWAFIRGYFDGDGHVSDPVKNKKRYPVCGITTSSESMLNKLDNIIDIAHSISDNKIEFSHNNAIDFLSKIYDSASIYMNRKRDLYLDWSCWVPSVSGSGTHGRDMLFRWNKSRHDAVAPSKYRASDSGYDLVVLDKIKQVGKIEFYDTGIKILPEFGWYFDLVPRSSLVKYGYMLANSIGIIDRTYTGSILVPLIKVDKSLPNISRGARIVQIIPRQIIHVQFEETDELSNTERGTGGFGSTSLK